MWTTHKKASESSKLPSELLPADLVEELGDWGCWCFDNCILYFGTVVENALKEQVNNGSKEHPDWQPKYTLAQLLKDDFRLLTEKQKRKQVGASLKAMLGGSQGKAKTKGGKRQPAVPESLAKQLRQRGWKL